MASHKHRKRLIDWMELPLKGTPQWDRIRRSFEALKDEDPNTHKKIVERSKKTIALIRSQHDNGTGLQTDTVLRHFHHEFNHRLIAGSPSTLPLSFNILEAFTPYTAKKLAFRILPQDNHLYRHSAFTEFATSPAQQTSDPAVAPPTLFPNRRTLTFENIEDPISISFSSNGGARFGVGGVSIVRHDTEVTVFLLAGKEVGKEESRESAEAAKPHDYMPNPRKRAYLEESAKHNDRKREVVILPSSAHLQQVLAVARFDLSDSTEQVRYVMEDWGDTYRIFTNDPSGYLDQTGAFLPGITQEYYESQAERLPSYSPLFELCALAIELPAYFNEYADEVVLERRKTKYGEQVKDLTYRSVTEHCPQGERIAHRSIEVLNRPAPSIDNAIEHTREPQFKIETSGYYKNLAPSEIGSDKRGNPVVGKTWVRKQLTWHESGQLQHPMFIEALSREQPASLPGGEHPGFIYMMRNATMSADIFKVGRTERSPDLRASELSRTSVPDRFFVLHEWPVNDCHAAEAIVHRKLSSMRIDPKREFFQGSSQDIVRIIEETLKEL